MKRHFLVIAMNLADLAAGMVFKRILFSMKEYAECDIICPEMDDDCQNKLVAIPCLSYNRLPYRIEKLYYEYNGHRLSENIWAYITYLKTHSQVKEGRYDAIISFVYASNFASLVLGKKLAIKTHLPWIVYSVDAIPAPVAWSENMTLRKKIHKYLTKYYSKADAIFATNPNMLRYELETFYGFHGYSGVVLTPSSHASGSQEVTPNKNPTFLYAGYLYGARKADALLRGFELFLKVKPDAKLLFVGNNSDSNFIGFEHLLQAGTVECHPFTKRIEEFYNRANILIDLNANIENDVFLSSKICSYLSYDKPIVTISQNGSPVRAMMSGVDSIIHCHHDAFEICEAMEQATNLIGRSTEDRKELQKQFKPEIIAAHFVKELDCIIKDY